MVYFEKSNPEPPCLVVERTKLSGRYDCEDVVQQLKSDFKGKCYLCEQLGITNPSIDHFVPLVEDPSGRMVWRNLFLCCTRCNSVKARRTNLLNCTRLEDFVDQNVEFRVNDLDGRVTLLTQEGADAKSLNTRDLLDDIYNGSTVLGRMAADHLQDLLEAELEFFRALILQFLPLDNLAEERPYLKNLIQNHLKNSSGFTAFKRWIIRDSPILMAEFGPSFT